MLIEINVLVQKYESDWVKRIMGSQPPSADSWNSNSNTEINRPYSFNDQIEDNDAGQFKLMEQLQY